MTYDYYRGQAMPMCESKLNQLLSENPNLINFLNRYSQHPMISLYSQIPLGEN